MKILHIQINSKYLFINSYFFFFMKIEMENILIIFVFPKVNVKIVQPINVQVINQILVVQNGALCIFSDALDHCNSDPNCGGYTMTTGEWFHTKYDKKGKVAVHLYKVGQKTIPCPPEWSSYAKQKDVFRCSYCLWKINMWK